MSGRDAGLEDQRGPAGPHCRPDGLSLKLEVASGGRGSFRPTAEPLPSTPPVPGARGCGSPGGAGVGARARKSLFEAGCVGGTQELEKVGVVVARGEHESYLDANGEWEPRQLLVLGLGFYSGVEEGRICLQKPPFWLAPKS